MSKTSTSVYAQRIAVADTLAREGRVEAAIAGYREIARDAARNRVPNAQGTALLRVAVLRFAQFEAMPDAFGTDLKRSIGDILTTTDPSLGTYREAAQLLQLRSTIDPTDTAAVDQLVTKYSPPPTDRPILVYQPRVSRSVDPGRQSDGTAAQARSDGSFEGQWVDVAFRISPDGRVHDVGVARGGKTNDPDWIEPTLKAIAGRRYAPMTLDANDRTLRRVERYTLTAFWETPSFSRMRVRGYPRIEMLDLSVDKASADTKPGKAGQASAPPPAE
jgi:hypothetical protein